MDAPPVRYVKTSDGYSIAYTVSGEGASLVVFPILFVNLQARWRQHAELLEGLARRFQVVTFDFRGEGMSTRGLKEDTSMEDYDLDTEAVISRLAGQ